MASATPSCDGDLHRAVEPDDGRLNPVGRQILSDQVGECGGDPLAGEVGDGPVPARGGGVAERGRAEAQRQPLAHRRVGLGGQIPPGDAEVQLPRPDVDRDVLGAQEEELDIVDRVDDRQVLRIGAAPVAGLREDLGGRLAQRALVGYRDPQHAVHSFR